MDEVLVAAPPEETPEEAVVVDDKKDDRPKKRAPRKEEVTVMEYYGDGEDLQSEIEKVLERTKAVAFLSMPKEMATPELVIWLRDKFGCSHTTLNVHSCLHIKDHDSRRRGGWVCHLSN